LKSIERAQYETITDDEALDGFKLLSKQEGIIPALESAHAIAQVAKMAPKMKKDEVILVCLSGRGDKDVTQVSERIGDDL
jgi:tryptophan synthase beta chain